MSGAFNRWAMRVEPVITRSLRVAIAIGSGLAGVAILASAVYAGSYAMAWATGLPTLLVFAAMVLLDTGYDFLQSGALTRITSLRSMVAAYTLYALRLWAFFYLISLFVPKGA